MFSVLVIRLRSLRLLRVSFLFSSRSRHTMCLSDWSSDVCSSDLFHRLRIDYRNAARPVLQHLVDRALAVADGLLRRAAEVDVPEHGPVLRVNHQQALGRMASDIDAIVGRIAVDAVRAESLRRCDRLDQLQGLDVEHRGLWMIAGEAVPG